MLSCTSLHRHVHNFCMSVLFAAAITCFCSLCAGSKNREFSFRHDWNSLISDDPSLLMKHYTEEYFPHADVYVYTYVNVWANVHVCVCVGSPA